VHLTTNPILNLPPLAYILPPHSSSISFGHYYIFIIHYLERYNATLKYEALKNEIELNNLKSQLNPHFIFNALNSIRALVDEDPDKSKDAITQLSSICAALWSARKANW
jgi:two-component system LytT family sensor kinase